MELTSALSSNTTGTFNTATGDHALQSNTAFSNTAFGSRALIANTTGSINTAAGSAALLSNTIGANNTAVGGGALAQTTTGVNNTAVGIDAGSNVATANNVICIGAAGNDVDNSCYIGNIFNATSSGGIGVFVNSNGRLGTSTSSRRFKEEIKPMDRVSEALFSLQPVTFRYKKQVDPEGNGKSQYGLVAEDVEKVNPNLIVRDKEGKPYSVRYDQVNAMLLNEFLKEHEAFLEQQRKVEQQEAAIAQQRKDFQATIARLEAVVAQQQKGMDAVMARLKEQDSKIQQVSDQIDINKFAAGRIRRGGAGPGIVSNYSQTVESNTISQ